MVRELTLVLIPRGCNTFILDTTLEAIEAMHNADPKLMSAATVIVEEHGKWSMSDVGENGGIWVKLTALEEVHPIKILHTLLGSARTCKVILCA